ncbi:hypothetical protein [Alicyclobacillus macrosporangiidus]|uniref:hypothetical protein n=1 Tax=Alicyclobacillus macrosporangiidus TaxID=392015 RepID=UPI000496BF19|nr:hypothetical protein [Alicyclobacillus macrosporangiidus]
MRKSVPWISIALITTFVTGCSNANTSIEAQYATGPVIESITAEPNGVLVTSDQPVNHLERIVVDPHFLPAEGHTPERFIFTLHNVVPGPRLSVNTKASIGTNELTIQRQENDLMVTYTSPDRLVNEFRIGTDKGKYLGIELENHTSTRTQITKPLCNIPAWYFHDLSVAAQANIPMTATTYGPTLPQKESGYMLNAPKNGISEQIGFSSYFGPIEISDLFRQSDGDQVCDAIMNIQYGHVMEDSGGKPISVPAILVWLPNAWALGFAQNQVIIASIHGGAEVYTVYSVPGIEIHTQKASH